MDHLWIICGPLPGGILQLFVVRFQRHDALQILAAGGLPEDRALQRSDSWK